MGTSVPMRTAMSEQEHHDEPLEDFDETAKPQAPEDDVIASLEKERDELNDRLLRAMADYQNYARRAEQNIVVARDQQSMDIAKALVTVLDHFDRALEVDADKTSTAALLEGVAMVRDELLRTLQRFGVERLDVAPGDPFDPNLHEAMMRQASDDVESNRVTAQFQPGYVLRDKTIRPAKVAVAE